MNDDTVLSKLFLFITKCTFRDFQFYTCGFSGFPNILRDSRVSQFFCPGLQVLVPLKTPLNKILNFAVF